MNTKNLRWLILSAIVFLIDWSSKYYFHQHFFVGDTQYILPFFNFSLAYNTGAAFSFLSGAGGWQQWFFGAIAVVICLGIIRWMMQLSSCRRWTLVALSLIIGGAMGNLVDRIHFGYVIDFIQVHVGQWYWPTFNVADSAIVIGVIMLLIEIIFFKNQDEVSNV